MPVRPSTARALLVALAAVVALALAQPASAALTATFGRHADGGNGRIVVARDDGSHKRVLGAGDSSQISPNGKLVAVIDYPSYTTPATAVLKLFRAAGGPPALTSPAGNLAVLAWSPDSRTLAATDTAARRLLTIDAATGARTTIAKGYFDGASFSPDSTRLAYATQGGRLVVTELAKHAATTLRRHAAAPVWGPRVIAFGSTSRSGSQTIWNVATIRPDGTHLRRLTHIHPTSRYFGLVPSAWSANGRRLATDTRGADGYWLTTYVVDAAHGGARLLIRGLTDTTISRNGHWIIGQTGDAECCGFQYTDVVRVPWRGGHPRILVRHAMAASSNG